MLALEAAAELENHQLPSQGRLRCDLRSALVICNTGWKRSAVSQLKARVGVGIKRDASVELAAGGGGSARGDSTEEGHDLGDAD
jgi:hypothetical protein